MEMPENEKTKSFGLLKEKPFGVVNGKKGILGGRGSEKRPEKK